jgi:hypothetical protein
VARFGSDRTVLSKRRATKLLEPQKIKRNLDTMQVVGFVVNEWNETLAQHRPIEIMVDSIGLGAGVADRLRELGLPAKDVNVSEAPAFGEKYINLRAELWFRGKEWLEKRNCSLMEADSRLIDELATVKYNFTSNGKIKVESKDDLKKRTRDKSSPDLADSFLLTFAGENGIQVAAGGTQKHTWNKPLRRNFARHT